MDDPGNIPQRTAIIQTWISRALAADPRLSYMEAWQACSRNRRWPLCSQR